MRIYIHALNKNNACTQYNMHYTLTYYVSSLGTNSTGQGGLPPDGGG